MLSQDRAYAAEAETPKQVMAFYYTWYGTPSHSGRWAHWDEGGHRPERMKKPGHRDIGATHHPEPDVYDSNDPAVIQRHLQLCEEMGVDALIATWWGIGDFHDRALKAAIREANQRGKTAITVYYEIVPNPVGVNAAVKDLLYILDSYGDEPAFLKRNGSPVIFIYGRAMNQLSAADWKTALSQVRAKREALFIADAGSGELIEIFDGGHSYNPVGLVVRGADAVKQHYERLIQTYRDKKKIACATVIPGYDDSNIGRKQVIVSDRRGGELYEDLWQKAIAAKPDWVLITSFNEWHEGSEIEPSKENGRLYVELTKKWVGRFKGGG
jgi:hypothetical protein